MQDTVQLGRIAGIRIGVNWTVLVIFALIFVGLAAAQFPAVYPDREPAAYALAGGIAAVAFFASLLAHELAHALVARRNNVEVDGITLWLFGGVARLEGDAPDPGADLRIAGVGPLVSVVLGVVFGTAAWLAVLGGIEGLPIAALGWLALINLVLAVFNLVPAAPLDGGRILRALLWRLHGDRTRAAIAAAKAGRVFGFVLIGLGLVQIVFVPGFGGIWLALIGWFLTGAAAAEEQQARVQDLLADIQVQQVMSPNPMTVPPQLAVQQLLDAYLLQTRFSTFPVVDDAGQLLGLVTLNRTKQVDPAERAHRRVIDIACPVDEVPTAAPSDPITELLPKLGGCADGRALVIDQGRVVGIVSPSDVNRLLEVASLRGNGAAGVGRA